MIPGFNTDIEHQGTVYHVQTEDKGVDNPLILSLIYTGGRILASKRTFYHELIAQGFNERALTEKLNRQHKLICAAILAGRIQDLINQSERGLQNLAANYAPPLNKEPEKITPAVKEPDKSAAPRPIPPGKKSVSSATPANLPKKKPALPVASNAKNSVAPQTNKDPSESLPPKENLFEPAEPPFRFSLVREIRLVAGEQVELKFNVSELKFGRYMPAAARIHVKILGTSFLPQSFDLQTDSSGFATLKLLLPEFNSGRAALVATMESAAGKAELRRIIHLY